MDRVKQQSFLGCAKTLGQALCQNPTYTILPDDTRLSILINCCKVYLKELKTAKDNAKKIQNESKPCSNRREFYRLLTSYRLGGNGS